MSDERQSWELPGGYRSPSEYIPTNNYGNSPQYPPHPVVPPPTKNRRHRRWLTITFVAVLLIVAISTLFIVRYITRSTPDKTLDTFCDALQQGNYQSAYEQFSPRLQRTMPEAAFAAIFTGDKVNVCTHGTASDTGTSVINTIKLIHASRGVNDDSVTLTKDSNDTWKIDDIARQT